MKNKYPVIALSSSLLSLTVALVMTRLAWLNDAQSEMLKQDNMELSYLLLVGASWFVPTFVIIVIVTLACNKFQSHL